MCCSMVLGAWWCRRSKLKNERQCTCMGDIEFKRRDWVIQISAKFDPNSPLLTIFKIMLNSLSLVNASRTIFRSRDKRSTLEETRTNARLDFGFCFMSYINSQWMTRTEPFPRVCVCDFAPRRRRGRLSAHALQKKKKNAVVCACALVHRLQSHSKHDQPKIRRSRSSWDAWDEKRRGK